MSHANLVSQNPWLDHPEKVPNSKKYISSFTWPWQTWTLRSIPRRCAMVKSFGSCCCKEMSVSNLPICFLGFWWHKAKRRWPQVGPCGSPLCICRNEAHLKEKDKRLRSLCEWRWISSRFRICAGMAGEQKANLLKLWNIKSKQTRSIFVYIINPHQGYLKSLGSRDH